MLQERMAESLVLLAHLLCVPLKDMVVLKVNARLEGQKVIIEFKKKAKAKLYAYILPPTT